MLTPRVLTHPTSGCQLCSYNEAYLCLSSSKRSGLRELLWASLLRKSAFRGDKATFHCRRLEVWILISVDVKPWKKRCLYFRVVDELHRVTMRPQHLFVSTVSRMSQHGVLPFLPTHPGSDGKEEQWDKQVTFPGQRGSCDRQWEGLFLQGGWQEIHKDNIGIPKWS